MIFKNGGIYVLSNHEASKLIPFQNPQTRCPDCLGTGYDFGYCGQCDRCDGTGEI